MSSERVPLCEPSLAGNARRYLDDCLRTNFVSSVGPFVERFERELAAFVGARHAVACSSGTAALHLAFRVLGVGAGDRVLLPTFTFVASANAACYQGASLGLIDSEASTWNVDPALVVAEIAARRPAAVELVHIYGHPADVTPVLEACAEASVPVIEDAAEALGARYADSGRHVGTLGAVGCFSFNGNKIITCGGGGMLVTDDEVLAARARHLSTQARLPGRAYRHDEVGYNYRMSNLAAALGVAQLEQLPAFLERKRQIAARYDDAFAGEDKIQTPPRASWAQPNCWLYSILVEATERDVVLDRLDQAGIDARPLWTPLHTMPMYAGHPVRGGDVAVDLAARGISLPSSVTLTAEQQERVIESVLASARRS